MWLSIIFPAGRCLTYLCTSWRHSNRSRWKFLRMVAFRSGTRQINVLWIRLESKLSEWVCYQTSNPSGFFSSWIGLNCHSQAIMLWFMGSLLTFIIEINFKEFCKFDLLSHQIAAGVWKEISWLKNCWKARFVQVYDNFLRMDYTKTPEDPWNFLNNSKGYFSNF